MTLAEIRQTWEKGLTPLVVLTQNPNCVVVLLEQSDAKSHADNFYHCHRYMQFGEKWDCSVDGRNVTLDAVWSWLNNPSARATSFIHLPEPVGEE